MKLYSTTLNVPEGGGIVTTELYEILENMTNVVHILQGTNILIFYHFQLYFVAAYMQDDLSGSGEVVSSAQNWSRNYYSLRGFS